MSDVDRDPGAHEARARAALAAHAVTADLATLLFRPLPGGLGNHTWLVERGWHSFVVRLNADDDAALGIDRRSEQALLQAVAAAGIAPPVVVSDPMRRLLVTRYVGGKVWSQDDARREYNLARLGATLTVLHECPPSREVAARSFRNQARHLEDTAGALELVSDSRLALAVVEVFDRLDAGGNFPTLCHNDVHHLNVIDDGTVLTLVDWEYGGLGNPCYDLAACVCYHDLDAAQRAALLGGYRGPARIDQLDDAILAFEYVQWLWYRVAGRDPDRWAAAVFEQRARAVRGRLARLLGEQ
jgi:thiamine kinase